MRCIRPRMKKLLIPVMALGLVVLAPAPAVADDTPLGKEMEALDDAYKALRRTSDAKEGAKLARDAQAAVVKAFAMTPELVADGAHPDGEEKAMAAYRKQIAQLLVTLCEIEEAFVAGDMAKVQELITPLRDAKKKGHEAFMEDE